MFRESENTSAVHRHESSVFLIGKSIFPPALGQVGPAANHRFELAAADGEAPDNDEPKWEPLKVEGKLPGVSIPEPVLREIGKGKQGTQRLDLLRFLAEIIPSEGSGLLAGPVVLSPTRLEGALKTVVNEQSPYMANTEVLRFEEICLPDRSDSDTQRRHIRRVVFIAVEWSHQSSLADVVQALADSPLAVRKSIFADLKSSDSHGYVIGEFRTRVSFVR